MKEKKLCEKNCKGRILSKHKGIYCDHIEAKLPKGSKQSIKAYASDRIEDYSFFEGAKQRDLNEKQIEARLIAFGLDPFETEIIMLRYIEQKPMKDIVKTQGWLSLNSANYFLRKALKKLREGRFRLR